MLLAAAALSFLPGYPYIMENYSDLIPDFARDANCAVTVCDTDGIILYMNDRAIEIYHDTAILSESVCSIVITNAR